MNKLYIINYIYYIHYILFLPLQSIVKWRRANFLHSALSFDHTVQLFYCHITSGAPSSILCHCLTMSLSISVLIVLFTMLCHWFHLDFDTLYFLLSSSAMKTALHPTLESICIYVAQDCTGKRNLTGF